MFRSCERLNYIEKQLNMVRPYAPVRKFGSAILSIAYPLICVGGSAADEQLEININSTFGIILCQVRSLGKTIWIVNIKLYFR